jgi:cytochrome oxidase Cu insertion factor (SCO1/SenC/PrrC family)
MKRIKYSRIGIMKIIFLGFFILITACGHSGTMSKESAASSGGLNPTDLERIQIGASAPDFNLESVDGEWVKLSNYQNKKNVILVFYRGNW